MMGRKEALHLRNMTKYFSSWKFLILFSACSWGPSRHILTQQQEAQLTFELKRADWSVVQPHGKLIICQDSGICDINM